MLRLSSACRSLRPSIDCLYLRLTPFAGPVNLAQATIACLVETVSPPAQYLVPSAPVADTCARGKE